MINSETHTSNWILNLKRKLGKHSDAKLIEKVIWALTLLEQLQINGLNFTFKGGTALVLATEKPKRFSIDIDIITEHSEKEITAVLQKIIDDKIFLSWEDDNNRKHTPDAPIGHFKAFYKSVVDDNIEPILLDLLYTPNPYPETQEVPIKHPWLITSGDEVTITMPTFDAILGDKLTAFAPKTTGILYSKNRPVEIIKQLYDIAFLFDNISDLTVVKDSFNKVVQEEIGLRGAEMIARRIKPNIAIVTDVTHDTHTPMINKAIEGDIQCGKGPSLAYAPAIHNKLLAIIEETAKNKKIPVQFRTLSRSTGTDTDSFAYANDGCPSVLISIPLRYMHTTVEMIHKKDIVDTIQLMYETLLQLSPKTNLNYL